MTPEYEAALEELESAKNRLLEDEDRHSFVTEVLGGLVERRREMVSRTVVPLDEYRDNVHQTTENTEQLEGLAFSVKMRSDYAEQKQLELDMVKVPQLGKVIQGPWKTQTT